MQDFNNEFIKIIIFVRKRQYICVLSHKKSHQFPFLTLFPRSCRAKAVPLSSKTAIHD